MTTIIVYAKDTRINFVLSMITCKITYLVQARCSLQPVSQAEDG